MEENGLVTSDGTKVLTVEEYDRFINKIPEKFRAIFEVNMITGLRYVELQRLHDNPAWYVRSRNQIILPKEAQKKVKQKQVKRTIDRLPSTFPYIFEKFINGKTPPYRTVWYDDLGRWSESAGICPLVTPKTPRKTIESWMLKRQVSQRLRSTQRQDTIL